MRHILKLLIPALAVTVLLAACGSSKSSSTGTTTTTTGGASSATVKTASNAALGKTILVTSQGMALYHLTAEGGGKFVCTSSSCLAVWHPLTVSSGTIPTTTVGSVAVVKRPDGTAQVTYNGMPLYTFAQDKASGEANGQGIKDVGTWTTIVVTTGSTSGSSGGTQTSKPSGSGGYGY